MRYLQSLAVLGLLVLSTACVDDQPLDALETDQEISELHGSAFHPWTRAWRNRRLALALFRDVFNGRDLEAADELIREDYIQHNPFVGPGLAGFKEFFASFLAAVPDLHVEVLQVTAQGNRIGVYSRMTGTYTGDFGGVFVDGREFDLLVGDFWRVQSGKLAEHWDVFDNHLFLTQLGVIE